MALPPDHTPDDARTFARLEALKIRLTNLSQRNRSLRLQRLSARRDIDLFQLGYGPVGTPEELLSRVLASRTFNILPKLSTNDERINLNDRRLRNIHRELRLLEEETGAYDLCLGYPFVEGRFRDGSLARCPLLLWPVHLKRNASGARWQLAPRPTAEPLLNPTFFRAYEKFTDHPLPAAFWDEAPEPERELQPLLNTYFAHFRRFELALRFNSELFTQRVAAFPDKTKKELQHLQAGLLSLQPWAVLGIFPQAETALLQDYKQLQEQAEAFPLHRFIDAAAPAREPLTPLDQPERTPEAERFFVLPVDGSQEHALLSLKQGGDLLADGPPGTGKSQLIVNAVADYLARGKRVLVVSQKRAALDVVHKRLQSVQLKDFCYLLHDHRNDRAAVYAQLARCISELEEDARRARKMPLDAERSAFTEAARQVEQLADGFDTYQHALTEPTPAGLGPLELYAQAPASPPPVAAAPLAPAFTHASLHNALHKLRLIAHYPDLLAPTHAWYHRHSLHAAGAPQLHTLQQQLNELPTTLKELQALHQLGQYEGRFLYTDADSRVLLTQLLELLHTLQSHAGLQKDVAWLLSLQQHDWALELTNLHTAHELATSLAILQPSDAPQLNALDAAMRTYCAKALPLAWFNGPWRAARGLLKRLLKQRGQPFTKEAIMRLQADLARLLEVRATAQRMRQAGTLWATLPPLEHMSQWPAYLDQKAESLDFFDRMAGFGAFPGWRPTASSGQLAGQELAQLIARLQRVLRGHGRWHALAEELTAWLHPKQVEALQKLAAREAPPEQLLQPLQAAFSKDQHALVELDRLLHSLTPEEHELFKLLEPSLAAQDPHWQQHTEAAFAYHWLAAAERERPILTEAASRTWKARQDELRLQLLRKRQHITQWVSHKLRAHVIAQVEFNRLGNPISFRDIAHQATKKRQIWPLRKLIEAFWHEGLAELMPCVLASPDTVAAAFPMVAGLFDLVIIDEASQCRVEAALPTLLRGKQALIAGDDKQLPPFDLFMTQADDAFDDDDPLGEAESILALARRHLPQVPLLWHYRSADEALIRFSNHHFYTGRLRFIPPPAPLPHFQPPLVYHLVNGRWHDRSNRQEAEAIVQCVQALLQHPDKPSIGIISFNVQQTLLIQDLLEARLEALHTEDPKLARRLDSLLSRAEDEDSHLGDSLFVKNIENVQGDERDVILFSTAYAPDVPGGRVPLRFGWLSMQGGENRLNVAITRARKQVQVFSSFEPSQLEVQATEHDGPKLLKAYLEYVRYGTGITPEEEQATHDLLPLQQRLASDLATAGYTCTLNLGHNDFRIHLAVQHPAAEGYLLALLLESEADLRLSSARERLAYRHWMLTEKGWHVRYLTARSLWLDYPTVLKQLLAELEGLAQPRS